MDADRASAALEGIPGVGAVAAGGALHARVGNGAAVLPTVLAALAVAMAGLAARA